MNDNVIEKQANIYVYDLKNYASEFGFKPDETWEVSMVSGNEKTDIEKKYFPTVSAKVSPEMLSEMLNLVKLKLGHQLIRLEKAVDNGRYSQPDFQYIVAYSPNRVRR